MADEYIRKADAIGAIWHSIDGELFGELESCAHAVIEDADNAIESLEPADVVPVVHGAWERHMSFGICDKCGYEYSWKGTDAKNYCPNCGAKMDAQGEE